jgi:hypothetical protein
MATENWLCLVRLAAATTNKKSSAAYAVLNTKSLERQKSTRLETETRTGSEKMKPGLDRRSSAGEEGSFHKNGDSSKNETGSETKQNSGRWIQDRTDRTRQHEDRNRSSGGSRTSTEDRGTCRRLRPRAGQAHVSRTHSGNRDQQSLCGTRKLHGKNEIGVTSWITDASVLAEIWAVKTKAARVVQKILNGKTWLGSATTAETGAQNSNRNGMEEIRTGSRAEPQREKNQTNPVARRKNEHDS